MTLLTWVEDCIHTNLPGSHEPPDLLHVSSSYNILEDDVIGEVHSSPCRCDGYDRCRTLLCLCALCWTVPWGFAVRGDVCGHGLVSWRVMWRGVVCRAVLCRGVLWRRGVCGCVVRWCVMWGGVIGGCVVRRRVLRTACVRWHRYMVVVLHPCSGCRSASPSVVNPGGGKWEIQEKAPVQSKSSILCFVSFLFFFPSCLLSFSSPAVQSPAVTEEYKQLHFAPVFFF